MDKQTVNNVKLPPKPGATVSALRPGLKLPPKPVIHKPGAAPTPAPLPKPITPAPAAPVVGVDAQGVSKLPTVEAKTISREETVAAPAPVADAKPLEALKTVTHKLKGITQPIPQQAILRKTGIIADGAVTEAQKEAAKHKTARISLSDAMGVAPVKDEHAPMKTIRIKRPVNIPGSTASLTPIAKPAAPADGDASFVADQDDDAPTSVTMAPTNITQRKTLKITRPGGAVRPAGKFGIKRPTAPATKPTEAAAPVAEGSANADVADIPDIPSVLPPVAAEKAPADNTPGWVFTLSSVVQAAAVVMMGALAIFLYQNTQTLYF